MLTSLKIEHFTLVKQLEIHFQNGMTAFTGETGAGKSILLDALMLALGNRGDASLIRKNEEKCSITAIFHIESESLPALWLSEEEIPNEENVLILKRVLYREGRSKSFINGELTPLHKVKEISHLLVHFHGQHEHYALQGHDAHRKELDRFSRHDALVKEVAFYFQKMQTLSKAYTLIEQKNADTSERAFMEYQLKELDTLIPLPNEMEMLHREQKYLQSAKDYEESSYLVEKYIANEEDFSVLSLLYEAEQALSHLPEEENTIQNALKALQEAHILCDEALVEVRRFKSHIEINPERLFEVESRLSALFQAARKFHVEPPALSDFHESLKQRLFALNHQKEELVALKKAFDIEKKRFYEKATLLSHSRKTHAEKLSKEVTNIIQTLGMPKGEVYFTVKEGREDIHGIDEIDCIIKTNPGMPEASIGKIASGGELSRISLAIQMVTASAGLTPTLLFDEVDVGIGGATAARVGRLLQTIGKRLQVFCVTHQPQVASAASHHFRVDKYSREDETFTEVVTLPEEEKIIELARMLGGLTVTEETRRHAKALREEACSFT